MINTKNPSVEFTAQDRCDRCGARAIACANKEEQELLFCRHHIKEHNLALEMSGWVVGFDYIELEKMTSGSKATV